MIDNNINNKTLVQLIFLGGWVKLWDLQETSDLALYPRYEK